MRTNHELVAELDKAEWNADGSARYHEGCCVSPGCGKAATNADREGNFCDDHELLKRIEAETP